MRNDCVFAKCKNKIYIFYYFSFLIKLITSSPYKLTLTPLKTKPPVAGGVYFGALGGGRTHNLRLRKPTLYPVELRAHHFRGCKVYMKKNFFKRTIRILPKNPQ